MTVVALLRKPSAFTPLAMSLAALGMIAGFVGLVGNTAHTGPPHDEGAPARIFQLLMVLQLPIIAIFALKWLPREPRPAVQVLMLQAAAALLAIGTIVWLES